MNSPVFSVHHASPPPLRQLPSKTVNITGLSLSLYLSQYLFIFVSKTEYRDFGSRVLHVQGRKKKKRGFEMATVPGQLIWEIVKKNNSFLVKQFGRGTASLQFSKENNNLYNLNSYKHSGTLFLSYSVVERNCVFEILFDLTLLLDLVNL